MPPDPARQTLLQQAFATAIREGQPDALLPLLADDLRLVVDGGGKAQVFVPPRPGPAARGFLLGPLRDWWRGYDLQPARLNAVAGFLLRDGSRLAGSLSLGTDEAGRIGMVSIMRNPDKLSHLDRVRLL